MAYCGILDGLDSINGKPVDLSRLDEGIIIAGDETFDAEDFIGDEEKRAFFNDEALLTKADILKDIDNLLEKIEKEKQKEKKHSLAFYVRYEELVRRFRLKVERSTFPEKLDNWWKYEYEVRETGIVLSMCHIDYFDIHRDDVVSEFADTKFELLHIKTKLLTVEQYAQAYGVTTTTVRQWIRRGKIRSAIKMGSEWRIPELAENNARGYRGGCYCRNETLTDLPEEYAFFNDYDYVHIYQNEDRKDLFDVCFGKDNDPIDNKSDKEMNQEDERKIQMNQKEREKFELYLIGNPFVEAAETCLAYRCMKE